MSDWNSDAELFELIKTRLYTPVVGDVLDVLGFTHQFLPQPVQPLLPEMKVIAQALKKATGENLVRKEIECGMSSTSAFEKYGIL